MPSAFYSLGLGLNGVDAPIRASNFALGGLLDQFPEAVAAYSLRSLRNNDGNEGVVIEMTDDCTYQPTYYTPAQLTDGTLDAYLDSLDVACGRSSVEGHVTKWYDQSGNGRHATQSNMAYAPKIVSGGQYLGEVVFDGSDDFLTGSHSLDTDDLLSLHTVATFEDLDTRSILVQDFFYVNGSNNGGFTFQNKTFANNLHIAGYGDDQLFRQGGRSELTEGSEELYSLQLQSGTSNFYINGSLENSISASMNSEDGGNGIAIGSRNSGDAYLFEGSIKEIIIYNSDQSSNRTGIENNINSHFNIYS